VRLLASRRSSRGPMQEGIWPDKRGRGWSAHATRASDNRDDSNDWSDSESALAFRWSVACVAVGIPSCYTRGFDAIPLPTRARAPMGTLTKRQDDSLTADPPPLA
jgi:hypothetical protein